MLDAMLKSVLRILLLFATTHAIAIGQESDSEVEVSSAEISRGERVFSQACVECHGVRGEGVPDSYESPLIGDSSVSELTEIISETMPEEDPDACVGEDAKAVAAYIHETFYSPKAQLRLNPPKRKLARLTAHQLQQSLADLYSSLNGTIWHDNKMGIRARYFNRDSKDGSVSFDRIDKTIDFDFGTDGPGKGVNAKDYSVSWNTALKCDVSGRYELVVRSSCAFVMYFGGYDREFINNYVQSETKTEFRKSVYLTAGRVYPLKIEMHQRKRKTEQPEAKISLSWQTPYGGEQIIPEHNFASMHPPATFALQTKLPPDDRSYGYERGIAVDRQWDETITRSAIEFADQVIAEAWPEYVKEKGKNSSDRYRLREFLKKLVETAFRGPLDEELRQLYIEQQLAESEDDHEVIRRVVVLALKSPRFLYPQLDKDRSDSQRAANRLALAMFDSLPADKWLLDEVKYNQLKTPLQIRDAARRMVDDWRVQGKTRQMLYAWLNLDHIEEISKDKEKYPEFDEELVSDLRDSLDRFLDDIVWSEKSDFRKLLTSNRSFTTPRIGEFYGEKWKSPAGGKGLRPTSRDDEIRFGVLSHPYLMSALAYRETTSPIHRGVFLLRYLLGRTLRPPNEAFTPLSPDLHPDLTTRERVQLQTSPENCQVCHSKINGLGFVLEKFDAVGRYQTEELGRAIDSSGRYTTKTDESKEFASPNDLANYLADSEDAKRAFVVRAFQHFVKQPLAAFGTDTEDKLLDSFAKHDYSIRELLVEIAVIASTQHIEETK